ncbi:MAG: fascin domain-containing protein, partial [Vicinamibacteria bacterium]
MSQEWKVEVAVESELEKVLQALDGNGFDVYGIFPALDSLKTRFIVVGRRELPEGRKKRRYEARPVAIRASNGRYLRWLGNSQPLHAVSLSAGDPETFWMIRLEGSYGESIAAFRAGLDQWLAKPDETFDGPATLYGPEVGSWQMFSVLPRGEDRVALRSFRLGDGSYKFLALDGEGRLEARPDRLEEAETFALEPIRGRNPEEVAVVLHW